jgi:O-antigen/teichoic acid export membrane protein
VTNRSLSSRIAGFGALRLFVQALSWLSTLLVLRRLGPADYGEAGFALIVSGWSAAIATQGMPQLVVADSLDDCHAAAAHQLVVRRSVFVFACVLLSSPVIAWLLGVQGSATVLMIASLGIPIEAFRAVPYAVLQRDLKLREVGIIDATRAIAASGASVAIAYSWDGPSALIIGPLIGALLASAMSVRLTGRLQRAGSNLSTEQRKTGKRLFVESSIWMLNSNADQMIATRVLGTSAAGLLALAKTLAALPSEKLAAMIIPIGTSILASKRDDHTELRRVLVMLSEGIAIVVAIPLAVICISGDTVIIPALGEKWRPAIGLVWILAPFYLANSVTAVLPQALSVTGNTLNSLRIRIALIAFTIPSQIVLSHFFGISGMAWGSLASMPIIFLPALRILRASIGLRSIDFAVPIVRAILVSTMVALGFHYCMLQLPQSLSLAQRTIASAGVGALLTVLAFWQLRSPVVAQLMRAIIPSSLRPRSEP